MFYLIYNILVMIMAGLVFSISWGTDNVTSIVSSIIFKIIAALCGLYACNQILLIINAI